MSTSLQKSKGMRTKGALEIIRNAGRRDVKFHTISNNVKTKLNISSGSTKNALQRSISMRRSKEAVLLREKVSKINKNLSRKAEQIIFNDIPQCIIDMDTLLKESSMFKDLTVHKQLSEIYQKVLENSTNILADVDVLPLKEEQRRLENELKAIDKKDVTAAVTIKSEMKKRQLRQAKENLKKVKTLYSTMGFIDIESLIGTVIPDTAEKKTPQTSSDPINPDIDTKALTTGSAKGYVELGEKGNCISVPHPILLAMLKTIDVYSERILNLMFALAVWIDNISNEALTSQKNAIKEETQQATAQLISDTIQALESQRTNITNYHQVRTEVVSRILKCPCYDLFAELAQIDLKVAMFLSSFIASMKVNLIVLYKWILNNYDALLNAKETFTVSV